MVGSTKIGSNLALSRLFSKGAVLEAVLSKNTLRPLGVKPLGIGRFPDLHAKFVV
jgi:hypothetical protein